MKRVIIYTIIRCLIAFAIAGPVTDRIGLWPGFIVFMVVFIGMDEVLSKREKL